MAWRGPDNAQPRVDGVEGHTKNAQVTAKDVAVAVSVRSATYRPAEESLSAMAEYRKEWRELHTDSKV